VALFPLWPLGEGGIHRPRLLRRQYHLHPPELCLLPRYSEGDVPRLLHRISLQAV